MIGAPMVSTYKFFPRFQAVITRENPPWADKCSAGCKNCKVKILPQTAYYMFAGCAQRILRSWIVHPQNQRNSAAIWRPWPLARTSSRFRYGSTWYVSSLNMTRILPPYFWIFWSPAVFPLITAPNQSLNSDHSMPNWIMPKHPSSGIQVESSCFRCIWFRCQSCPPNWKFTNRDRVVVLSFGNTWGSPSTQPTSNSGFIYRTFLFLSWLGLRTGLTQVTLW